MMMSQTCAACSLKVHWASMSCCPPPRELTMKMTQNLKVKAELKLPLRRY